MGMYEGMFIDRVTTAGETTVYGKLALNEIYPQNPNNNVYYFASWNNLMGDPATQIWTASPQYLIVDHDDSINQGSNNFQVQVSDSKRGFSNYNEIIHPKTEVVKGVLEKDCSKILTDFFKTKRY